MMRGISAVVWAAVWIAVCPPAARADDGTPNGDAERQKPVEMFTVIGSAEGVDTLTGSGQYLDAESIRAQGYDDINRVLRRAPGVYVREEDGYGLFPNISLRGVDSQRTSKLTIMEDGILTAPATYSAPAAYYSPASGRMHAIEVLKGSSQIQYGPHSTGGVINYLSTPISDEGGWTGHLSASFGTNNELRQHGYVSNAWDTSIGRVGFLFEHFFRHTDGFKETDGIGRLGESDDTGFRRSDPMVKLFFEPKTDRYQRWELKVGGSDLDADETYLGLTDTDFDDDDERRYAASRFDNIDTNHFRSYLRWTQELSDSTTLTTTGYYNKFKRNWFKLRGDGADLGNPDTLACFQGLAPAGCDWDYRNNRREYYSGGIESIVNWLGEGMGVDHDVRAGVRVHQDRVRREQDNFTFVIDAGGAVDLGASGSDGPCTGGCRYQRSRAVSLFVHDSVSLGDLTIRPGVRLERVRQDYHDSKNDARDIVHAVSPGVSALYVVNDDLSIFGGIHRGVSTASPRGTILNDVDTESSLGFELGGRATLFDTIETEVTLFYTEFSDLLVVDNIGSGGTGDDENVGDVIAQGVEMSAAFDLADWFVLSFGNPWHVAVTWTRAELDGDGTSTNAESIFAGGKDGADLPYIPTYQVSVGTALEFERFTFNVDASFVDQTFSTAVETRNPVDPRTGAVDYNFGGSDAYAVVDLSGRFKLSEAVTITANLHNLFDERYVVSRHPIGPRPGRSRSARLGFAIDF